MTDTLGNPVQVVDVTPPTPAPTPVVPPFITPQTPVTVVVAPVATRATGWNIDVPREIASMKGTE